MFDIHGSVMCPRMARAGIVVVAAVVAAETEAVLVAVETIQRLIPVPVDLFPNETGGLQTCLIGCP